MAEKKKKSKLRKIVDWCVTGLFAGLLVCSFGALILSKANKGYIFDYQFPTVLTDSMSPDYPVSSVLVVKKLDPSKVEIGDDIMFMYDFGTGDGKIKVTHRIIKIEVSPIDDPTTTKYKFTAHGINTKSQFCGHTEDDEWVYDDCTNQTQTFTEKDLLGKVVRKSPTISLFYGIVSSKWGLIVIILIPALYLVVTSVIDIFKALPDDEEVQGATASGTGGGGNPSPKITYKSGEDPLKGLSSEEKEKLKKQILDEMLKGKGGNK